MSVLSDIFSYIPSPTYNEPSTPVAPANSDDTFKSMVEGNSGSEMPDIFGGSPVDSEDFQREVEELYEAGEELISEVLDTARDSVVSVLTSNETQSFIDAPSLDTLRGVVQSDEVSSAITAVTNIFQTEEFQNVVKEATDVFRSLFGFGGNG